jgi:hypothetical protein
MSRPSRNSSSSAAPAPKQQLKLKLRQSPGSDPNTPGARSSATPGIIVDSDALLRQQRHVREGVHGSKSSRPPSQGVGTPVPSSNPFSGPKGTSAIIAPIPASQAVPGFERNQTCKHCARQLNSSPQCPGTDTACGHGSTATDKWQSLPEWSCRPTTTYQRALPTANLLCPSVSPARRHVPQGAAQEYDT